MNEKDLFVVSESTLSRLRDLHRRRDEQAFIAGCATLEFETKKRALLQQPASEERTQRLGALLFAFDEAVEECFRKVRASETDETNIGTEALRMLGLDLTEELRIDMNNGAVLLLKGGHWEPKLRGTLQ